MADSIITAFRTRGGVENLAFDAYFPDEAGLVYKDPSKSGLFLNKFTRVFIPEGNNNVEITQEQANSKGFSPDKLLSSKYLRSGTIQTDLANPLDPSLSKKVKFPEPNIPISALGHISTYSVFAPHKLIKEVRELLALRKMCLRSIKVSLFFGTGSEMGRHGLRTFIEKSFWRIIINVPGVETQYEFAKGKTWGIGISEAQIREIIKELFKHEVDFVVDRIFGYSTGYSGVTGTIRNELIPLRNIEVLGFFDCNYGEFRVQEAIKMLRKASPSVKVIAYASSKGGTPTVLQHSIPLDINKGGIAWLFGKQEFVALTHARILASGLNDKTVNWSEIDSKLHYQLAFFFNTLPQRGTVVSEPTIHQLITGTSPPSGTQTLISWYNANKVNADFFLKVLWNKSNSLIKLIWKHQLPGWDGGVANPDNALPSVFTEGVHDFLPFEFAWEVLG